ncbi:hypothetical protein JCGZ_09423 [Jatropha curcas]|uniref:WRKY transcription factor 12 n=2 Tax=Jatropha curcas TaxID=180498 RepID=S5CKE4_JATCU|nr:WRKY transcription factor 12 [Jatropha curcas]KDP35264.1 hypothetical protein JCGZ_09423 [Jatropha curcas]
MDYPPPANPNSTNYHHFDPNMDPFLTEFQLSDYLVLDGDGFDGFGEDSTTSSQSILSSDQVFSGGSTGCCDGGGGATSRSCNSVKCKKSFKKEKAQVGHRVAFRTKSELEVMDDGFKWRKYGKKSVKNSPNPRNYYKCSSGGCNVKKRVERDREDSRYVITTYDGIHNHESPCMVYYNQMPLLVPNAWTSQASSPHSSSSS